jgi:hypothetical protein
MAYGDWTIGGLVPCNIESVEKDPPTPSNTDPTITFHCVADYDLLNADPRTEIALFDAMACQIINNDQLLNGGSKLQVQGGNIITIVESAPTGDITYTAAIESVKIIEDSMSDDAIWYDIVAHYETSGKSSSFVYIPPYWSYSNMTYSNGTDGSNPSNSAEWAGNELGIINITETKKVREVQVRGSACTLPAWIEINGQRQSWDVCHDVGEDPTNLSGKQGVQTLTFNDFDPSTAVNIHTSNHVAPWYPTPSQPNTLMDRGCWLLRIRVIYE